MKKFFSILMLLTFALLVEVAAQSPGALLGGFRQPLRGFYNDKISAFRSDVLKAYKAGTIQDLFYDPAFIDRLIDNARQETGSSVTLEQFLAECTVGDAPVGFKKTETSTHEMSVWTSDGLSIARWGARNPYSGEKFIWFRGKCIMSLYCGNLVRSVNRTTFPQTGENGSEYLSVAPPQVQPPTSTAGVTINNYNGAPPTQQAPLGESSLRFADRPRAAEGPYSRQDIYYNEPGLGIKNIGIGVGTLLLGVSAIKTAYDPPVYRSVNYSQRQCYAQPQYYQPQPVQYCQTGVGYSGGQIGYNYSSVGRRH